MDKTAKGIESYIPVKFKMAERCEDLVPTKNNPTDSGFDLKASQDYTIYPGQTVMVSTGLFLELPKGYEAQVRSRSGLAGKHSISVKNSPGTVDESYRGEVRVLLNKEFNMYEFMRTGYPKSDMIYSGIEQWMYDNRFVIKRGDRIAQMVISKVDNVKLEPVEQLSETTRGANGFGSSEV